MITVHPGLKIALISTAVKRKPTNVAAKMVIKLSIIKNIHQHYDNTTTKRTALGKLRGNET